MKNKTHIFFILVLIAVLWFSPVVNKQPAPALADAPAESPRYITVTGDAEVRVIPDEVILNLGVETQHVNLHLAKDRNDEIVERVLDIAESYGIEARHIQIDYIYIDNNCYYSCSSNEEYFVRKTIAVTLKDIDKFEALLTSVIDAGVTNVHGIEFRTTELREHKDTARALAIRAAKEKAIALTGELDQTIGLPTNIQENYVGWNSWYSSWWGHWSSGSMAQNVIQEVGNSSWAGSETSAPGQISVNARVSVTFEIRN
jgi:uncharacterized protein YggE